MKRTVSFFFGTGRTVLLSVALMLAINPLFLSAQDLETSLVGTWVMTANGDGLNGGEITFTSKGKYQFEKKYSDGTGATESGCFRLDTRDEPAKLILCLGDCGGVGSEWTTCYCLVRLTDDGELELFISPDSNFPKKIPRDRSSLGYYLFSRLP